MTTTQLAEVINEVFRARARLAMHAEPHDARRPSGKRSAGTNVQENQSLRQDRMIDLVSPPGLEPGTP